MSVSCYHCGLEAFDNITASVNGQEQRFCCEGCKAIAQTIHGNGLSEFYQYRESTSAKAEQTPGNFEAFDLEPVQRDFVFAAPEPQTQDSAIKEARLYLADVRCAACVWLIEQHLRTVTGVVRVRVNASAQTAAITFDPQLIKVSELFSQLASIGYRPEPLLAHTQQAQLETQHRTDLLRLGVAGIGMMQAGMVSVALHAGEIQGMEPSWQGLLRWVTLFFTLPVLFYSAQTFFQSAFSALRARRLNMDVPVSLALLLAFSASVWATVRQTGDVYFDSVAMFTFFLLLGRYLEKRTRMANIRARIKRAQSLPLSAIRQNQGQRETVPLKLIAVDDQVWVPAGATVPCDAVIVDGESELDESVLTGESLPVVKAPGDSVIAGSVNGSTGLSVRVTAIAGDTELAAIERLVDSAELNQPRQVSLADAVASKFVAGVLGVATVVGAVWLWLDPHKALWVVLSVLVVTCPCALGLATPAVLTAAVNRLRNLGVLVTGANALETLADVQTVLFDKTGTLTRGKLQITEVKLFDPAVSQAHILAVAATLEQGSAHPIAKAFEHIPTQLTGVQRRVQTGRGVAAKIKGQRYLFGVPDYACTTQRLEYPGQGIWLLLSEEQAPLAWIKLEDTLRDDAKAAVLALKQQRQKLAILSGDRAENVTHLSDAVGVSEAYSQLLPDQKLTEVKRRQALGQRVLMVGDGINDVPVLAAADVSVAMGSATEFAQSKASCILLGDQLMALPKLLQVAKKARSIIRQNITWAIGYNLTALPLAALGFVPPWAAAIGMSLSSLVVVANALRISHA